MSVLSSFPHVPVRSATKPCKYSTSPSVSSLSRPQVFCLHKPASRCHTHKPKSQPGPFFALIFNLPPRSLTTSTTFPLKNFHSSAFLLSLHIMWARDSAILHLGSHKEMSLFCYISSSPPLNPLSSPWHSFQRAAWSPFVLYPSIFSYYFDIIPQVLQIHHTWPVGAH